MRPLCLQAITQVCTHAENFQSTAKELQTAHRPGTPKNHTIFSITALWEVAPAPLRAIIAFMATYKPARWDPFPINATRDTSPSGSDVNWVALITLFMRADVLCKAFMLYEEIVFEVKSVHPLTHKHVRPSVSCCVRTLDTCWGYTDNEVTLKMCALNGL